MRPGTPGGRAAPRFPLLLLDLDGTLVDSFADIASGLRAACARLGIAARPEVLGLARRGVPLETFYRVATGRAPDDEGFREFATAYRESYRADRPGATRPYPGVRETLECLRSLSPAPFCAVATTKRRDTARLVLRTTGLLPLLDAVVGSDGLPPKPDPGVLLAAARQARMDVRQALMVGDTDRDILAARAAGCEVAAVTYGGLSETELRTLAPDHMLAAFADLLAVVESAHADV